MGDARSSILREVDRIDEGLDELRRIADAIVAQGTETTVILSDPAHDALVEIVELFSNPYRLPPHQSDWETVARECLRIAERGL